MTVTPAAVSAVLILHVVILLGGSANAQNSAAQSHDPDVLRVAGLQGKVQHKGLRLLLIHFPNDQHRFYESVFYQGAQLRSALRALVQDPKVGTVTVDFLTLIGEPDDLRFIILHPPRSKRQLLQNRWAYGVACSLLDATTEEDWVFLRNCALNKYTDGWVEAGAIQTLKLIASPRSRELLEEIQRHNQPSAHAAVRALEYVRSEPTPLAASNLKDLAARVALTIKIGNWQGNGEPRYSEGNDKALIDFEFSSGRDRLIYTATFSKTQSIWRLRGVRETAQILMSAPPVQAFDRQP